MANHSMPKPESPKNAALPAGCSGAESDLGELAALFAAQSGGGLSAEVSADLALEIVLNEIVEQACLATGATGAAIVLVRDGEMMCRASSGANVPELGAPLGNESGLTAECIKTGQAQRCDDAQADPRADGKASRSLGVRSVMIFPLLRKGEMAGVLEVVSPRAGAFGDQDDVTLEALAHRILKNLERASEPLSLSLSSSTESLSNSTKANAAAQNQPPMPVSPVPAELQESWADSAMGLNKEADDVPAEIAGQSAGAGLDVVTLALGAAVLACAVLLGTLVGVRLGWRRATVAARGQVSKPVEAGRNSQNPTENAARNMAAPDAGAQTGGGAGMKVNSASDSAGAGNTKGAPGEKRSAAAPASSPAAASKDSFPPAGSLLVYENGKEVFRMPPAAEGEASKRNFTNGVSARSQVPGAEPGKVQRASALEPAGVVELAPDAAEGSLLHRVEPEYPEEARQQRIQGAVVLEVRIAGDGAIQDVKLVSGPPLLANAAIAAVKQWRFKPRLQKGRPVEMQTRVTLNFRMPA
jgi:TonB family protein